MNQRSTTETLTFVNSFTLEGVEGTYPPGTYDVEVTEDPIPGLSFIAYRRVSTTIRLPSLRPGSTASQIVEVLPDDLSAACARDQVSSEKAD